MLWPMAEPDDEAAKCRDDLLLKMATLPPMTHAELKAKLAAERAAAKKGREPKSPRPGSSSTVRLPPAHIVRLHPAARQSDTR